LNRQISLARRKSIINFFLKVGIHSQHCWIKNGIIDTLQDSSSLRQFKRVKGIIPKHERLFHSAKPIISFSQANSNWILE
jgi:hypothetical protein